MQGRQLTLLCSNSAPPLTSKFVDAARLPAELLDASKLRPCLGTEETTPNLSDTFLAPTLEWMRSQGLDQSPSHNLVFAHADFRCIAVTKFTRADYAEFLKAEWPLERMQPIVVTVEQ